MKKLLLIPIMVVLLGGFACQTKNSLAQNARDTSAALGGLLTQAQNQYMTACTADKTQPTCTLINRGVAGQNALISATESYCGFKIGTADPTAVCVPVASAQAGLQAALSNATQLVNEIKKVVQP